ncbi:calcium-binding protein [Actinoplanes teichomyceticus]|uniref:Hemolysin type calcium-binding protein n=1 Tax=Actinoplanes teichomyceticus TaxID=1867 RepID=A0A561WQS2_ACTTI|nr:calcium-binding protein [Actinoplanes teichomyceticus]TWG26191.1 hemolysin type calcium-binding protein [Actinoplanes teichomyceticus]GIF11269.1 hypothetical protein Ate01nite_13010 [Actinoplanes teichomyceticus]
MARSPWLSRAGGTLSATLLAGVAVLAGGSPAQAAGAGKASVDRSLVSFVAGSGKANRVVITRSGRTVTIDDKYPIKAGKGCKAVKHDRTKVRCTSRYDPFLSVKLGSKDDRLVNKTSLQLFAYGSSGNDVIDSGSGPDVIKGGTGTDRIYGGGGNDHLDGEQGDDRVYGEAGLDLVQGGLGNDVVDGGTGNDVLYGEIERLDIPPARWGADILRGGAGRDSVSYTTHTRGVTVDLDGGRGDDGMPGEHDSVGADVEIVTGSPGDDTLIGNTAANTLDGSDGDDTVRGGGGNDTLSGGAGTDAIAGEAGDDAIDGVDPSMEADQRADRIDGGGDATGLGDLCRVTPIDLVTNCER